MTHLLKHRSKKSLASADKCSGIGGGPLEEAMWNKAETWMEKDRGELPTTKKYSKQYE
jgi:hypothetical protein